MVFESLFHCVYVVHDYPVEFKRHPTIPEIEASRCGVVKCVNEDDRIEYFTKKATPHLVYETWTGTELLPYTNLRYRNMNPHDTSFDNLEILRVDDVERQEKEKAFLNNTVNQMLLREKQFGGKRDMIEYFTELGVPQRFLKAYQKEKAKHF